MRVLLVGTAAERARLKSRLDRTLEVVAEFATVSEAHAAGVHADALVLASDSLPRDDNVEIVEALTAREVQVLELLAEGLPNKGIAGRLGISDQTVKFHVASICGKLGAKNRTEAVRLAIERGMVAI